MENIATVKERMSGGCYMATVDLTEAGHSVPKYDGDDYLSVAYLHDWYTYRARQREHREKRKEKIIKMHKRMNC